MVWQSPQRNKSRQIKVGNILIGGDAPISIQSMTNTVTSDVDSTLAQIRELAKVGCEIIRSTVPDEATAEVLPRILEKSPLPLIADIHFDYRLALAAIKAGVHGVRINPGNIGSKERVRAVAEAAGNARIPIRVGANSGSLPKGLLEEKLKNGLSREHALAESLVEAALYQASLLEEYGFRDIKVSLKASNVPSTVAACRIFAQRADYPLHLGVTEAGTAFKGAIKSAVGIGALLLDGIGNTLRVSLSAPPVEEIRAAKAILESCGIREAAPEIVSCPTCGRTSYNLMQAVSHVEKLIDSIKAKGGKIALKKIAVMGCEVNGPGEAADADIGIAGGNRKGSLILFKKGVRFATLPETEAYALLEKTIYESIVNKK